MPLLVSPRQVSQANHRTEVRLLLHLRAILNQGTADIHNSLPMVRYSVSEDEICYSRIITGGYPQPTGEPGFHAPPPQPGYNTQYAPQYGASYGAPPPPPHGQSPYPSPYPGYGAPPPQPQHAHSNSHSSSHSRSDSPAPHIMQHGYGVPPPIAGPISTVPVQFTFAQKNGYDASGSVKSAGKTVYKLKDEADKHTFTAYLKSRVSIETGTSVAH